MLIFSNLPSFRCSPDEFKFVHRRNFEIYRPSHSLKIPKASEKLLFNLLKLSPKLSFIHIVDPSMTEEFIYLAKQHSSLLPNLKAIGFHDGRIISYFHPFESNYISAQSPLAETVNFDTFWSLFKSQSRKLEAPRYEVLPWSHTNQETEQKIISLADTTGFTLETLDINCFQTIDVQSAKLVLTLFPHLNSTLFPHLAL